MVARKISPEQLLESEASLRRAHELIQEFRRSDAEPAHSAAFCAAVAARREITAVLDSLQQYRAGLPAEDADGAWAALQNVTGLLANIEGRVRLAAALLDSEASNTETP